MFGRFDRSRANAINPLSITGGAPVLWLDGADSGVITQVNGLISQWNDKSGGGYNFAQATDANKPYLARSDSLENRLLQSENVSNGTAWPPNYVTAPNATTLLEGAGTGVTHNIYQTFEGVKGATYDISAHLKRGIGSRDARVSITWAGGAAIHAYVYLNDGTVGLSGSWSINPTTSTVDGRYKVSGSAVCPQSGTAYVYIYIGTGGGVTFDGDSTSTIEATKIHLARTGKGYVTTTTYPQYAGLNGRAVPYFPGTATYMSRAFTAALDIGVGDNTLFAVTRMDGAVDVATNFSILDSETYQTKGAIWRFQGGNIAPMLRTSQAGASTSLERSAASGLVLLSVVKSGTTGYLYQNGAQDSTSGTVANAITSSPNALTIGRADQSLRGYLPEIIVFNRALSDSERMYIENYLRIKWGI